ncbi:MAG: reverse transcriptase [Clostridiales bacterium]|nr:reverse transcriptase [Clostridiales bacterium]
MIKFEDVFNFKNLYEAHLRARKCKRHKREVVDFEVNLAQNLTKLEKSLQDGTYKIQGYKRFMIYDPKEREIQALSYYDRIVQNCLCYNFMVPVYCKKLIYDNAACQKGKGTHFARARLERFLHDYYKKYGYQGYVLKVDIKKYFNNINHQILKQIFSTIYDFKLKDLVFNIIDSFEYSPNKGVPMGNQTSQIFALLYLNNLDRIIKTKFKIKYYIRYMDDLILIHSNKQNLIEVYNYINLYVQKVKIELNKKSKIFAFKNGIDFLGVKYKLLKTGKLLKKMKRQSKDRMLKRIKFLHEQFFEKIINKQILKMSLAGFKGNIKRLNVNGVAIKYLSYLKSLAA